MAPNIHMCDTPSPEWGLPLENLAWWRELWGLATPPLLPRTKPLVTSGPSVVISRPWPPPLPRSRPPPSPLSRSRPTNRKWWPSH